VIKKSDLQKKIDDLEKNEIIKNYLHAISIKDQEKIKMYEQDFEPNIKEYNDAKNQLSTICQNEDFEKQIYNHLLNFFLVIMRMETSLPKEDMVGMKNT